MIRDAISKIQSFLQHPTQKVSLALVDHEKQISSHLENYFQQNMPLVIHFDLLQPNLKSLLDNLPKTKLANMIERFKRHHQILNADELKNLQLYVLSG